MTEVHGPRTTPYVLPKHRLVRPTTTEFASLCGAIRTDMFPNTAANRYDYDAHGAALLDTAVRDDYHALYEWTREYTFKRLVRETVRPRSGGAYEIHPSPDLHDAPVVARRGRCVEADGSAPRESALADMMQTVDRARTVLAGFDVAALITCWNLGAFDESEARMQALLEAGDGSCWNDGAFDESSAQVQTSLDVEDASEARKLSLDEKAKKKADASETLLCQVSRRLNRPPVSLMDESILDEELARGWLSMG